MYANLVNFEVYHIQTTILNEVQHPPTRKANTGDLSVPCMYVTWSLDYIQTITGSSLNGMEFGLKGLGFEEHTKKFLDVNL